MYNKSNYWKKLSKKWEYLAPPFRPHSQDIDFITEIVNSAIPTYRSNRILILGVTPEFAQMEIPGDTELIAVDSCEEMIENVWPQMPCPNRKAVLANWLDLPFENQSFDIVLGDGVLGTMKYPTKSRELLRSVKNVLQPGGLFVIRTFLRDECTESPAQVIEAAFNGEIGSLTAFKFRFIRSTQPDIKRGANYGNVWKTLVKEELNFSLLSEKTGWPLDEIETMKLYNGADFVLTYPTLRELCELFREEQFEEIESFCPDYELGEFCQTVVFKRTN